MNIKTYKANTNISINVVLQNKKNMHISFTPLSDGSSVYVTDNAEVQQAIERHYKFGKLFRLAGTRGAAPVPHKPAGAKAENAAPKVEDILPTEEAEETDAEASNGEAAEEGTQESDTLRKVQVSDIAAAKDYLADTFGISRTAMRSQKAILEKAAENGIEFEGL